MAIQSSNPTDGSSKEHFEKVLARLLEILVLGKTHLKIGRAIGDTVMTDPAIAHVSPIFWGMTMTAHLDVAQLAAFKLFDKRNGTMTVEYLLKAAEQCADSFPDAKKVELLGIVSDSRAKSATLGVHLKPLNAKRNRILAHIEPTIVRAPEKLAKDCQVKFTDLEAIFEVAGAILNNLSIGYKDTSNWLELLHDDDFEGAIQLIADAKHAQAEKFEREFGGTAPFPRPKRPKSPY